MPNHTIRLALSLILLGTGAGLASQPGEYATGPQTEHVAGPINFSPKRPTPMAVMNYETFEATVDHADLADCPKALAKDGRFCRAVLHGEALHVFAFSEDFDQPLQAVMAYPMDEIRFPD